MLRLKKRILSFLIGCPVYWYMLVNNSLWWFFMGFPGGTSDKESARQCSRCKRIWSLIGKIPWRRAWQSMPGESMDRGTWWAINHRVAQSRTRLKRLSTHSCDALYFCAVSSNFSFFFMILWIWIFSLFCQWDWLKIYRFFFSSF